MSENDSAIQIRFFNAYDNDGVLYGQFSGTKPKLAANKAFVIIQKSTQKEKFEFSLIEDTFNHKYKYIGERNKLDKPIEYIVGTNIITMNFQNKVIENF